MANIVLAIFIAVGQRMVCHCTSYYQEYPINH